MAVFDNLWTRSPAARSQLPTVVRCVGCRQLVRPRDSTTSPGILPPHYLSTEHHGHYHHYHHHHGQHVDHRAYHHLIHRLHNPRQDHAHDDDDNDVDDEAAANWTICDVENGRMDTGIKITAIISQSVLTISPPCLV